MKTYTEEQTFQACIGMLATYLRAAGNTDDAINDDINEFVNNYNVLSVIKGAAKHNFTDYKEYKKAVRS